MSKYIFLHIGMGKTGTTTLQYGLRDNYSYLLKHGWLYPKAGRHYQEHSVHHNVAFGLRNDPRFLPAKGGINELVKEIERSRKQQVVISSEVFTKETAIPLHEALSSIGLVKIVIYLRRQIYAFQSLWSQEVKTCATDKPFEAWARSRYANGNYFGYINEWAKIFGRENIIIRPLEAGQMHGHILEDFLSACGFKSVKGLTLPTNKNVSPGIKTLEAIRFYTRQFGLATPPLGEHYSYQIAQMIIKYADRMGWNNVPPRIMSKELGDEIEKKYEESNNNVAKIYLKQEKLFLEQPKYSEIELLKLDDFSAKEVFRISAYLLKRIEENPRRVPRFEKLIRKNRTGLLSRIANQVEKFRRDKEQ